MRLSLRLILFLVVGITLVTFFISRNEVRAEKLGLRQDLERRAEIFAESLQEIIEPAIEHDSRGQLRRIVERFENRQQLAGVIVYGADGAVLAQSSSLQSQFTPPAVPTDKLANGQPVSEFLRIGDKPIHAYYSDARQRVGKVRTLAIFHDASYIEAQSERIWRERCGT